MVTFETVTFYSNIAGILILIATYFYWKKHFRTVKKIVTLKEKRTKRKLAKKKDLYGK